MTSPPRGSPEADFVCGGTGNDSITGSGSTDIVRGAPGTTRSVAGGGPDVLWQDPEMMFFAVGVAMIGSCLFTA